MENKRTKYFLGIALLCVWGLVGYRIYDKYFGVSKPMVFQSANILEPKSEVKNDSFDLYLTYADPFRYKDVNREERPVTYSSSFSYNTPSVSIQPPRQEVVYAPPPIVFPDLIYKGNIRMKTGRIVALVAFNGSMTNWGLNESLGEMQLTGVYDDSIHVQYKGIAKTFRKAQ
jgi:hypothetical protein